MNTTPRADGAERSHITCGHAFGKAICDHLGIDPGKAFEVKLCDGFNQVFGVTISVALTPADLAEVARRMEAAVAYDPAGWGNNAGAPVILPT